MVTARNFPHNTCPASRHVELMADALAKGDRYAMFEEEPEHCAESLRTVVESLWALRSALSAQQEQATMHCRCGWSGQQHERVVFRLCPSCSSLLDDDVAAAKTGDAK